MERKLCFAAMLCIAGVMGFTAKAQSWKGCAPENNKEVFLYNVGTGKYLSTSGSSVEATLQEGSGLSFTLHLQNGNYYSAYTTIKNTHGYANSMLSFSTHYNLSGEVTSRSVTVSAPNSPSSGWFFGLAGCIDASSIDFKAVNGQENTYLIFFRSLTELGRELPLSSGACYIYAGEDEKSLEYSENQPANVGSRAYWKLVTKDEILSAMQAKTSLDGGPLDVSLLLPGRSFHYNDKETDLWTTTHVGGSWDWTAQSGNYCGNEARNNTFDVQQIVTNLPNGIYEVRCSGFGTNGTTFLYANEKENALMSDDTTIRGTDKVAKWMAIQEDNAFADNRTGTFIVQDHKITLGVRRTTNKNSDRAVWDEFRLYFYKPVNPADIQLTRLDTDRRYYKSQSNEMVLTLSLTSLGETEIPNPQVAVTIDGEEIGRCTINATIGQEEYAVQLTVPLKNRTLSVGKHLVQVEVCDYDGGKTLTDGTTDDDVLSRTFTVYEASMARNQTLMEFYTQLYDDNSPSQMALIDEMLEERTDVAPVFIHGDYFGDEYLDPLSIDAADYLAYYCQLRYSSSVVLNRTVVPGFESMAIPLGIEESDVLSNFIDDFNAITPSLACITYITPSLSRDLKTLQLEIAGQRLPDFRTIFGNGALTVYLTEDKVSGSQYFPYGTNQMIRNAYVHNHVLRKVVNVDLMGDEIMWGGNGERFQTTYTVDIDDAWELENMNVVAAIGRSYGQSDLDITNAFSISLKELMASGIEDTPATGSPSDSETYDLSGRPISQPTRGIYIQRSAGQTRKLIRR